jgi:hypothetical protein
LPELGGGTGYGDNSCPTVINPGGAVGIRGAETQISQISRFHGTPSL